MDAIVDIVGDSIPESLVTKAVVESGFNSELALDHLLKNKSESTSNTTVKNTPQTNKCKCHNFFST